MHPAFSRAQSLTKLVIGAAIEVHRDKGPGLIESICEWCLACELRSLGIQTTQQAKVEIQYKSQSRQKPLRFDLLVDNCLLIEIKAVDSILPIHKAQLLSYMKLLDVPLGLLINFNVLRLADGISRMILKEADR
jgi:GxxExxY protein